MLESLLGQAKTLFGKTFLIAGVLPAASFLFVLNWYLRGSLDGVAQIVTESLADSSKLTASAIITAVELIALALFLFASRGFFFYVIEDLPIRRLRSRFILGQIKKRQLALATRLNAFSVFNSAMWALRGKFEPLKNVEVTANYQVSEAEVLKRSATSRKLVARANAFLVKGAPYDINLSDINGVASGLHDLFILIHKDGKISGALDKELKEWRQLVAGPTWKQYAELLVTTVRRTYNESIGDTQKFPTNDLWVKPTAFGNRLSALNDYSKERYGIATSVLWPRLWRILTSEERTEISDKQLLIEAHLNLGVVSFLFLSILAGVSVWNSLNTLVTSGWDSVFDWQTLLFALGASTLAAISYYGAVFALGSFAESVKSLIDVRVLQLLPAVGYKPPFTVATQLELMKELGQFFIGSAPRDEDMELVPPGTNKPDAKKEESDKTE